MMSEDAGRGAYEREMAAYRAAFERSDYATAVKHAAAAVEAKETGEAYEALANAATWDFDEQLFQALESAYRIYREDGEPASAARVAIWLAVQSIQFRGQTAVANGWLRRAERLLDGLPPDRELSMLHTVRAQNALMLRNAAEEAARLGAEGARVARAGGHVEEEMVALSAEGLALVTAGMVEEGMSKLDEAATACVSGEVRDRLLISTILCYMVDACDRVRDFDRAVQWCKCTEEMTRDWAREEVYAQCRPHYAVVLTWRGQWDEAERELAIATREMSTSMPAMVAEGVVRLAELRWRQGRWDEAQSLFDQVKGDPLSQVGMGFLVLDRGEAMQALHLAERCLRRLPLEDRIERAPALELAARAALALGEIEGARVALAELEQIEAIVQTKPPRAIARIAAGLVALAEGRHADARRALEDAIDLYESCRAPFETARARLELASLLLMLGTHADAAREAHLALEALQSVGALKESERARSLLRRIESSGRERNASSDGLLSPREHEVLRLLAAGRSNSDIAEDLVLSVRTVERHISNIYEKLGIAGRSARAAAASYFFNLRAG